MKKLIGQNIIINNIETLTLSSLPQSLILLGECGSGKHTIFNLIIEKLNVPYFDITENISLDILDEIYTKVEPIIYLINLDTVSIKNENMLLKFVEEPPTGSYIIFLSTNKANILPTILNRCQIWQLEPYTEDQLRYFLSTKFDNYTDYFYLTSIFNTPGQLINAASIDISSMIKFIDLFINHIGSANFANTLIIPNKINFKNDTAKWDFNIFIKILLYRVKQNLVENYSDKLYNLYVLSNQLVQDNNILHINKQHLFENYLVHSRSIMRD